LGSVSKFLLYKALQRRCGISEDQVKADIEKIYIDFTHAFSTGSLDTFHGSYESVHFLYPFLGKFREKCLEFGSKASVVVQEVHDVEPRGVSFQHGSMFSNYLSNESPQLLQMAIQTREMTDFGLNAGLSRDVTHYLKIGIGESAAGHHELVLVDFNFYIDVLYDKAERLSKTNDA